MLLIKNGSVLNILLVFLFLSFVCIFWYVLIFKNMVLYLVSILLRVIFMLILVFNLNLIFILVKILWCFCIIFFLSLKEGILNVRSLLIFGWWLNIIGFILLCIKIFV